MTKKNKTNTICNQRRRKISIKNKSPLILAFSVAIYILYMIPSVLAISGSSANYNISSIAGGIAINASSTSYNLRSMASGEPAANYSSTSYTGVFGLEYAAAEDAILWVLPVEAGTTIISGNTLHLQVNFTDTSTHLYEVRCNITDSGSINMWDKYVPPSVILQNTTYSMDESIDLSTWQEGNYSVSCAYRDV